DGGEEANALTRAAAARGEPPSRNGAGGPTDLPGTGVRAVALGGRARLLPAADEGKPGEPVRFLEGVEAGSGISGPLRAREQPLGAGAGARAGRRTAYGAGGPALLEGLPPRVAVALDRARLYREVEERADAARVLEHVGDGILLLDRNGTIRLWNPAAEAITSIPAESVLGQSASQAIPGWQDASDQVPVRGS